MTEEYLDDLSQEYAEQAYSEPIKVDEDNNEYYQIIAGEESDERFTIDSKFYPIIDRYL